MDKRDIELERLDQLRDDLNKLKKCREFQSAWSRFSERLVMLRSELESWGVRPSEIPETVLKCQLARIDELRRIVELPDDLRREITGYENPPAPIKSKGGS